MTGWQWWILCLSPLPPFPASEPASPGPEPDSRPGAKAALLLPVTGDRGQAAVASLVGSLSWASGWTDPFSPFLPHFSSRAGLAAMRRHLGCRAECHLHPPRVSKLAAAFAGQPWTPDQEPQEAPWQPPSCAASAALPFTVSRALLGRDPSPSCAATWAWNSFALLIKAICSSLKNGSESLCSHPGCVRGRAARRLDCVHWVWHPAGQKPGRAGWLRAPLAWREWMLK